MLHKVAGIAAHAVYKRAVDGGGVPGDNNDFELPHWALLIILANLLVFLPLILYTGYTLGTIFPVLATVETTNPPAYEPVSLSEDAEYNNQAAGTNNNANPETAVTSSLRAVHRLLFSVAGWRSIFRGIWCAFALSFSVGLVGSIFSRIPLIPSFVGTLLATLALVQLSTAWVHIVLSSPNAAPFWRRLPPFKRTLEATWLPILASWVASTLAVETPALVSRLLGLPSWNPNNPHDIPEYDAHVTWKSLIVLLVGLAIWAVAVVPATVLLVRVQASLLPPDEDTIIPFDRSFQGTLEPAIAGGKGYVSAKDALNTVSRADWIRIYLLHVKIFAVVILSYLVMGAIILPQLLMLPRGNGQDQPRA